MDLNLLPLFVLVAQTASFTAAAARLGVKRSSVSRGVATLERSLGVQLFSRTTRSVALTTAGADLFAKVGPRLASLEEALGSVPEREELPSGELRLTAPNDVGETFLPAMLAGFCERYPSVRLDVRVTNRRVDLVAEGFDVALRAATKLSDSSLVAKRLANMEMLAYASPTYLTRAGTPKTPAEAASHAWVWFRGMKPPATLPALADKPQIVVDDLVFVANALRAGMGIGFLPPYHAQLGVAAGRLVRVLPRVTLPSSSLYFVYPQAQHVPRKVTALRDYMVEYLEAHPLGMER